MIALVLTFDRNAALTEHMMHSYRLVWPNHPFVFRIPYQSESRKSEAWGDSRPERRQWVKSPVGIQDTMASLLEGLPPDAWVYWCIDDKYPEALHRPTFEAIHGFLQRSAEAKKGAPTAAELEGVLPCRARQMWNPDKLGGPVAGGTALPVPLLWRTTWDQIWIHQFLRPRVLRHLFDQMPSDIPAARAMDVHKFDVPLHPGLTVTTRNAVQFGESLDAGEVLLNTVLRFRALGRPLPAHLPVRLDKAVTMGALPVTWSARMLRLRHKAVLSVLRRWFGRARFAQWIHHEAGWEMVTALRHIFPSGDFTFFDVGSNNGSSAIAYAAWFPRAKGELFEAHPDIAQHAVANVAAAGCSDRLTVHKLGLSNRNGPATFHVSTADATHDLVQKNPNRPKAASDTRIMGSNSLLEPDAHVKLYPDVRFETTTEVALRRAEDWLAEAHDREAPAFLHMDTQGAELMVMEGFGEALTAVQVVWMEVSRVELYKGQPLVADISAWMSERGFVLVVDAVGKHWGDQLWVRREWATARLGWSRRIADEAVQFQRLRIHRKPY